MKGQPISVMSEKRFKPGPSILQRLRADIMCSYANSPLIVSTYTRHAGCSAHTWPSWYYKVARFVRAVICFEFNIVDVIPPCVKCVALMEAEIDKWVEITWLACKALGSDLGRKVIKLYIALEYETLGFPLRSAGLSSPMWINEYILRLPGAFVCGLIGVLCAMVAQETNKSVVWMFVCYAVTSTLLIKRVVSQLSNGERRMLMASMVSAMRSAHFLWCASKLP